MPDWASGKKHGGGGRLNPGYVSIPCCFALTLFFEWWKEFIKRNPNAILFWTYWKPTAQSQVYTTLSLTLSQIPVNQQVTMKRLTVKQVTVMRMRTLLAKSSVRQVQSEANSGRKPSTVREHTWYITAWRCKFMLFFYESKVTDIVYLHGFLQ